MGLTLTNYRPVHAQTLHRLLHILNINDETVTGNGAGVGSLPAGFSVERGLVKNNLNFIPGLGYGHGNAVHQDCAQLRLGAQLSVTSEDGAALIQQPAQFRQVSECAFLGLSVGLGALPLLGHELTERLLVHLHPGLSSHFKGEVDGEAVGIVERERLSPRDGVRAVLLGAGHCFFQPLSPCFNGVQERFLFGVGNARNTLKIVCNVRECTSHCIAGGREQNRQARFRYTQ